MSSVADTLKQHKDSILRRIGAGWSRADLCIAGEAVTVNQIADVLKCQISEMKIFTETNLSQLGEIANKANTVVLVACTTPENHSRLVAMCGSMGFTYVYDINTFMPAYNHAKLYSDYEKYSKATNGTDFAIDDDNLLLSADWFGTAGDGSTLNNYYVVQDLWGAQKIFEAKPAKHYDIGSRVDYFIAHLLAFKMPTTMIDIRPLETYGTEFLSFVQADATNLDGIEDNSIESISALSSIEHFGLGRYGDPLDPNAHIKAFNNIQRVTQSGGNIYISVPVDTVNKVCFNAHRAYAPQYLIDVFNSCDLIEFSYASDYGLVRDTPLYAVVPSLAGLFHFRKR